MGLDRRGYAPRLVGRQSAARSAVGRRRRCPPRRLILARRRGIFARPRRVTHTVLFREDAERDTQRALDWYSLHAPMQVGPFIDDLAATVSAIRDSPHSFRVLHRDARRAALKIFPYLIWYRIHDDAQVVEVVVEVVAVVHQRQDGAQFRTRLH
ncbi:MAG: hypothetical protein DI566_00330 [Microbacterium sp.]|nr:MAG: hypothetical protein DI566_00330 [Microbacterium sp.]